jgi:class 3 adenylate cyclase
MDGRFVSDSKSIDHLVVQRIEKEAELAALGHQIQESASKAAVMFVDLCDSTKLKAEVSPENWLGYVYSFIQAVGNHSKAVNGTVVKRIGDELMLVFGSVKQAEDFIARLKADSQFNGKYRYKIAADFGNAYHFKFAELGEDDPYGSFVDRCARIGKFAVAGSVLASLDYVKEIPEPRCYISAGNFYMKGFVEPQGICLRIEAGKENEIEYYRPLLKTLNNRKIDRSGYRYVMREFTPEFFKVEENSLTRPFMLRELLNVPKLPYSFEDFQKHVKDLNNAEDAFDYYGSLVEWRGIYNGYHRQDGWIQAFVYGNDRMLTPVVCLMLVPSMFEVVRTIPQNAEIGFRRIIKKIESLWIWVNYVDIEFMEEKHPAA